MRQRPMIGGFLLLAACAQPHGSPPPPITIVQAATPTGARIVGTSTFATIDEVPPSPTADIEPRLPAYRNEVEFYALDQGLSLAEATRRVAQQQAMQGEVEALMTALAAKEAGNYVGAEMVHRPDWGYRFYFKRDPEATLARYTRHPRFVARSAAYTEAELLAAARPWIERLQEEGALGGYGLSPIRGRAELMVALDEVEYRALAQARGWGAPPETVRLDFARALPVPAIDPRVKTFLKGFSHERRSTVLQLEAGFSGRLVLDDGCLRLATKDGSRGPLAVFHRETGIGLDSDGYIALIDRATGKPRGRVGEMLSWAGPNDGTDLVGLDALKAACGDGPVANLGNPESQARFDARHSAAR